MLEETWSSPKKVKLAAEKIRLGKETKETKNVRRKRRGKGGFFGLEKIANCLYRKWEEG